MILISAISTEKYWFIANFYHSREFSPGIGIPFGHFGMDLILRRMDKGTDVY
jgi:hypothetical protein